jgi:hypothetical protein
MSSRAAAEARTAAFGPPLGPPIIGGSPAAPLATRRAPRNTSPLRWCACVRGEDCMYEARGARRRSGVQAGARPDGGHGCGFGGPPWLWVRCGHTASAPWATTEPRHHAGAVSYVKEAARARAWGGGKRGRYGKRASGRCGGGARPRSASPLPSLFAPPPPITPALVGHAREEAAVKSKVVGERGEEREARQRRHAAGARTPTAAPSPIFTAPRRERGGEGRRDM